MRKSAPKKSYHHPDLRSALIREGLVFMKDHKVDELSLRELARRLKVSHMAPYRHFADKETLIAAMIEEGFKELTLHLAEPLKTEKDFETLFYEMGKAYVHFVINNPDHARLMFGGFLYEPGKHCQAEKCGDMAFGRLLDMIRIGQEQKVLRNDDPMIMAFYIWSGVHGFALLMIERQFDGVNKDASNLIQVDQMVKYMSTNMLGGLRASPQPF